MIIKLSPNQLVIEPKAMGVWCQLPYPRHPRGCPNYGKKRGCPPFSKQFNELYQPPYYIVVELFDLESHVKRMKEKHPTWTEKQCRNLLYWQKTITKSVKKEANLFIENSVESNLTVVELPEATGINIFITCKNINLLLDRNPQKTAAKIMMIAKKCS